MDIGEIRNSSAVPGSNLAAGTSILGGALMTGYNILNNELNRGDFRRQQAYNNWAFENQMQIRARDLQRAGLHPSLALGNSGAAPASSSNASTGSISPSMRDPQQILANTLAMRQQEAQIDLTSAEANRVRQDTARLTIDNEIRSLQQQRVPAISQFPEFMHGRTFAECQNMLGLTSDYVEYKMKQIESQFMSETKTRMPTSNLMLGELSKILEGLNIDPNSSVGAFFRGLAIYLFK